MNKYQFLSRLIQDCEYVIKTAHHKKHLWANDVEEQIKLMKETYNHCNPKPDWCTMDQIEQYHKDLKAVL